MRNNYIIILVSNIILLVMPFVYDVVFATPDDYFMALFASGSYSGSPSPYIVFSNIVYGKLLSSLYTFLPVIEWYSVLQFFVGVIAFNILLYNILAIQILKFFKYFFVLVLLIVQLYVLFSPNFTLTAAELSLGSIVLLRHSHYIMSFAIFIIAFLIRSSAAFIPYMVIFPLIVLPLELNNKLYRKSIAMLFMILFVSFGLHLYNRVMYSEDTLWKDYMEYNSYRGLINDNPSNGDIDMSFFQSQAKMNEYILLTKYWISDGNVLKVSDMKRLASYMNEKRIVNIKKNLNETIFHYGFVGLILLLLMICLFFHLLIKGNREDALIVFVSSTLFVLANFYMISQSYVKERVTICFLFSILYVFCCFYVKHVKTKVPLCILLAVLLLTYSSKLYAIIRNNAISIKETKKVEQMMKSCPNGKIVFHSGVPMSMNAFHLSDNIISQKVIRVGWPNKTPLTLKYYKGYISHVNGLPFIAKKETAQAELDLMISILSSFYHQEVAVDTIVEDNKNIVISFVRK